MGVGNDSRIYRAALRVVAGAALALTVASCGAADRSGSGAGDRAATGPPGASVVLIVNDTMRRDRLGAYGGTARTPAFDRFAAENLLFDAATTQSPWTKPSIATLFTSMYPSQHGVVSHPSLRERAGIGSSGDDATIDVLSEEFVTLAETLQSAGVRTAGFVGNPWLEARFGFGQGFDTYDDSFASWEVPGGAIVDAALRWLQTVEPGQPFFLYVHTMDTHRPYGRLRYEELEPHLEDLAAEAETHPPALRQRIGELVWLTDGRAAVDAGVPPSLTLLSMAYDRGVEQFDRVLAAFLQAFRSHEAYARTAIAVTSDHGEALYDRGWGNHGTGLYEDEVAIPLVLRVPGHAGGGTRIDVPVGLVDLLPTLAGFVGASLPEPIFGRDWLAPRSEEEPLGERHLVTEGVMFRPENRAVRHGPYKALWQPHLRPDGKARALFRVVTDRAEANDLLIGDGDAASAMGERFNAMISGALVEVPAVDAPRGDSVPLDPDLAERLRSLGYIQ